MYSCYSCLTRHTTSCDVIRSLFTISTTLHVTQRLRADFMTVKRAKMLRLS